MGKVKVGIIGFGFMGSYHAKVLKTIEEAEIYAVADISKERLAVAREKYGVPRVFENYEDLLELKELDAVIVATPPDAHVEPAIAALKRGLYVLLEKPMGVTLEDAMKVYEEAKKSHGKLMVGFSLRFHSMYIDVKKRIDEGFIGEPINVCHVANGRIPRKPEWIKNKEISGGMVNENAVHVLYVFYWYCGKPREVYAKTFTFTKGATIEDNAVVVVEHENGALSTLVMSWSTTHPWRKWSIIGKNGSCTLEGYLGGKAIFSNRQGVREEKVFPEEVDEMYRREDQHFISCAKSGETPVVTEEDGLIIQKIVSLAYESAKTGKPSTLS